MPLKIGITGGIGSGKTVVSNLFEKQGYSVFYADRIAKKLLTENENVKSKIIAAFGNNAYDNGLPNKEYLAKSVFNNPEKLKIINSIIHPPTISKIKNLCEKELLKNDLVFTEAALIYEANMRDIFDYILVITADDKSRIQRIMQRDNLDYESIKKRIINQIPEENKISRADFVIHNNGSFAELEGKANLFLNIFKSLTKRNFSKN